MRSAQALETSENAFKPTMTFGVCAPGDPRIDTAARQRTIHIVERIAAQIAQRVNMPDGTPVTVVYATTLIDGEPQADLVARQFKAAHVDIIVCTPDTWAFPQPSFMSLLAHFPQDMLVNITCGNSAPKPGVVFAHALNGALAQSGRLVHLNVGGWPDAGDDPVPSEATTAALIDWCYAALCAAGLRGKRVVLFGHDSMGMETALAHIIPTRRTFGLEITRLDMKLLADMLANGAYDRQEHASLKAWMDTHIGTRLDLSQEGGAKRFDDSLAMYLIMRDLMHEVDAIGGAFMNQLEWGSDLRGLPLPICDLAESLFNATFDHKGAKAPLPFATEADTQGLITMLAMTWLSGGNPPLFMDFRKVWGPEDIQALAKSLGQPFNDQDLWASKGFIDGCNSGSASLDWAGQPADPPEKILRNIALPGAEVHYFPGGGNSVSFTSPGGIEGIAGRMAYSHLSGMFSMVWDEAYTIDLPNKLAQAVAESSNATWPHTWVVPRYATMDEYKQYAPANHFHMIRDLNPSRLQYWMDLTNVLSVTPWQARPRFVAGKDRPWPLLYLLNGGEDTAKLLRARG